ncbi:MAP3K epsilon protein kinase 1-like isoform X1 [Apium graveolens]|uniref:MAP3K epsilon protein kinase 1-like isoform X1 n=1 Tax=Apium graveolens TaxID=4045 RepID=UPI003D7B51CD
MLGDEIGRGAHGIVYKGLNLENGEFVAIKQVSLENIKDEDLKNIMQEIDLLKNLNHKNIVKYLGSSKTTSHLHIFLEYVENGSLANIIKPANFDPFPESLVAVYITQGLVKLADFGVATKLTDTNSNESAGTTYWMAPEVINMSGVCAASDIWSVGCTVIELLTGLPPYYDLGPWTALWQIVQDYRQRLDAKTLLSHPWIQRSRRIVHSPLHDSETSSEQALLSKRSLCSEDAETSSGDDQNSVDNLHAKKAEDSETEFLKVDTADADKDAEHNPLRGIFGDPETSSELHQVSHLTGQDKVLVNDETGSPTFSSKSIISKKVCVEESSNHAENGSSSATSKSQEFSPPKGVEYSRLILSLRPDEPEDVLVSACQKLTAFFHQSPEQRLGFLTQHGFVPLVELLEVPNIRVICSVLQVLNEITRDSTEIQESTCLAGLIPTVMGFAVPDRPHEIRMEAAKFLHQFCHSREMVHLAIDGLWQIFKLQWSSSRNDLFHIAAKTGILLRLISTLYSLNEATQLAAISTGGGLLYDAVVFQQMSSDPEIFWFEPMVSGLNSLNYRNGKHCLTTEKYCSL